MPAARGGRAGGRADGRGRRRGAEGDMESATVTIAGTELNWDLTGLVIQRAPAERFPGQQLSQQQKAPPPQAPPPTYDEASIVQHFLAVRDRIHDGPFYTVLNDGMPNGLKRKANEPAPTEASLFNPFTDNQTYSAKYLKTRRRLPKLDARPYVIDLFPAELHSTLDGTRPDGAPPKKRILGVTKVDAFSQIERLIRSEQDRTNDAEARAEDEIEEDDEAAEETDDGKPDALNEDDSWSVVSSDSEESDDDYNAEQYFDNGEDDDIDDADPYENTYE